MQNRLKLSVQIPRTRTTGEMCRESFGKGRNYCAMLPRVCFLFLWQLWSTHFVIILIKIYVLLGRTELRET